MVFQRTFTVGLDERGVVFLDGVPSRVVGPGNHRLPIWDKPEVKTYSFGAPLDDVPEAIVALLGKDVVTLSVGLNELGVLLDGGVPKRLLSPGKYRFLSKDKLEVVTYTRGAALDDVPEAAFALLGKNVTAFDVKDDERGVLLERGVATRRLAPGRHRVWTDTTPTLQTVTLSSSAVELSTMSAVFRRLLAEDLKIFDIAQHERALLVRDSVATAVLPPGRHAYWSTENVSVVRYDENAISAELPPAHATLLVEHVDVVSVARLERAVVSRKGKPVRWLPPGQHHVWKHPDVSVSMVSVKGTETTPLDNELRAIVPATDYVEVTVPDGAMGVRFTDGAIDTTLSPGRHAAFCVEHQVTFISLDLRERVITVQGQDILTKDKVSLRLNTSLTYRVTDILKLVKGAKSADEVLYLAVQLGLREQVAQHTLDEILSDRVVLAAAVRPLAEARATELGLELVEFGVKDIILPGDMKTLLNKVIEAHKTAEANVILRREETAAVRSMAATAKILEENPVLMRLKELEAYKELADKVGTVNVVLGGDADKKLELKL